MRIQLEMGRYTSKYNLKKVYSQDLVAYLQNFEFAVPYSIFFFTVPILLADFRIAKISYQYLLYSVVECVIFML